MDNKKEHILWQIQNRGKYEIVYSPVPDYDPEYHWFDEMITSVIFNGHEFKCPHDNVECAIDDIIHKFPDSYHPLPDVDMVQFCKDYCVTLLDTISSQGKRLRTKTNLELVNIVICSISIDKSTMYSDIQLNSLFGNDFVLKRVYSFVRDNMEKFV